MDVPVGQHLQERCKELGINAVMKVEIIDQTDKPHKTFILNTFHIDGKMKNYLSRSTQETAINISNEIHL